MRKIVLVVLSIIVVISLGACTAKPQLSTAEPSENKPSIVETQKPISEPTPAPTPTNETVIEKEMTLQFSFGERTGIYTGEIAEGMPNGEGKFTTLNDENIGWFYEGKWANGHFEGLGTTVWDDGFKETGEYKNDELEGPGQEFWNGVMVYDGNYQNGIYNGQGTLYNDRGDVVYAGSFNNGYFQESAEQREARLTPFKQSCKEMAYADYYISADNETGDKLKLTGEIFQVYEQDETEPYFCDFLMYAENNENQIVQVYYRLNDGEPRLEDGQTVTVYGTVEYLYSYVSKSEEDISAPHIEAWSVE